MAKDKAVEEKKLGMIVSRKPHPVTLSYGGEALVVPPRGVVKKIDKNKLGALPKDVTYVE